MRKIHPKARGEIPKHQHIHIDSALKDLKNLSKCLVSLIQPFENELRVLERLYYKSKNQHRSAVFWHRVGEVRRYGKRIVGQDIPRKIEGFRYIFYTNEESPSPQTFRNRWIQVPTYDSFKSLFEWLASVSRLLLQARSRFCHIYSILTSTVRCGSFLPLLVSLLAILSRLNVLIGDLQHTLSQCWQSFHRIFQESMSFPKLDPCNPFAFEPLKDAVTSPNQQVPVVRVLTSRWDNGEKASVDGQALPTVEPVTSDPTRTKMSEVAIITFSEPHVSSSEHSESITTVEAEIGVHEAFRQKSSSMDKKSMKTRKKQKHESSLSRDEIDEIFDQ